ncbi:DegT/DnrJ/EryC1/StrS family aminotransferase [Desulfotalea psychrophila]|uniref:DegT/DnrJ/EryC1/StrS family aminotransferase n=1 Tax=Desulfotalea psychrophila TaxID=84980 RepID=A0ABS3AS67_9BACT|nr:DegT/DnrJ/EryC1/StrS family aminotransferase [Desulfocapsa sp.]MBN4065461.1 DegT/DnrJ/EryC1/StrS family aminotransferase [Desulfocapsa sp. AH-315-G09]MBN4067963.1 DegT/DnrJ/EryC1/StrS family aminotransferase [Desulfotalea psychrophila]MBN4071622.1 DegT/DnrJ/EryC1/StrS family aminotransferase [Desulfotalea psychrophila]
MKIPLLDLGSQLKPLREEIIEAVTKVIDSTTYIQGPEVIGLESEVANYCNTASAVGVSSGTDALLVALMALKIGPGDRVLTTSYSFFATMGVIVRCGAKPVFADIDPVSYNIDPLAMAAVLKNDTDKTIKAIIPVHLYGQCADMTAIMALADQYDIPVVEDAAQAIGAEYPLESGRWVRSGSMGIAGCFSFFPSKNLGGIGDGGMLVSNDSKFGELVRMLRNHGAEPKYYHAEIGGNFRLDPIQATVLRIKLKYLEKWHAARRENASAYNTFFAETSLLEEQKVKVPVAVYKEQAELSGTSRNYHIYNQYVITVENRDGLIKWLTSRDIGCEIYYPLCLHEQECLAELIDRPVLPHAEKAARSSLALPIYPELTLEMQKYVVEQIVSFYKS